MASKWEVMDALKRAKLKAPAKAVVMMLLSAADTETAAIPAQFTPSLDDLAEWTSLARSTVAEWLDVLEETGWVERTRPSKAEALGSGRRTLYRITVGLLDVAGQLKRKRPSKRSADAMTVRHADGHEGEQSATRTVEGSATRTSEDPNSPPRGLVDEGTVRHADSQQSATRTMTVRHADLNSPPRGHSSSSSSVHQSSSPPTGGVADAPPLIGEELFDRKPETQGQHANRLTKVYYARVPMSNFIAVSKIVGKAIESGYDDERITAGLNALADDPGRAVSLNTLRIAIEGGPKQARSPDWRDVSNQDHSEWTKGNQ